MASIKLLSTAETADALGVSIKTLEYWRMRGEGPSFIKLPRAVRYSEEALAAFIESCTRTATAQTAIQATKVRSIRQSA